MTTQTFLKGRVTLYAGDCLDVLPTLAENSVDSVCCDPPYHLTSIIKRFGKPNSAEAQFGTDGAYRRASAGFMGRMWDGGDIAFRPETWAAVLRVLKPGAHLVAFAAPKNAHRMFCAIEDGGFEIRDTIAWLFGSGFPKSHDVSKGIDRAAGAEREVVGSYAVTREFKGRDFVGDDSHASRVDITAPASDSARQWEGWGTALKPAYEPICLARKPLIGTVAANVLRHGVGAINIDGCRVSTEGEIIHTPQSTPANRGGVVGTDLGISRSDADRFRASQSESVERANRLGRWPANVIHDGSEEVVEAFPESVGGGSGSPVIAKRQRNKGWCNSSPGDGVSAIDNFGDSGSAARFFYTAKADSDDRLGSKHPTVKPLDLMQYLVRLVTPPKGVVLDCFAGAGTTAEAAWREGFNAILIEREPEYLADIERRMSLCLAGPDERARESIKARQAGKPQDHGPLFGEAAA